LGFNIKDPGNVKLTGQRGFTVLELMIAIALLAILLSVAVPSFIAAIQNNRLASQGNELITALQVARSEALKRSRPYAVCASDTSEASPTCDGSWEEGWMVVSEAVGSQGSGSVTAVEIIRLWPAPPDEMTIESPNSETFVRYLERGDVDTSVGTFPINLEIRLDKCTRDSARNVRVSATGRAVVERVDC
jgi:type IV fimbrial biogenesis protein FimT